MPLKKRHLKRIGADFLGFGLIIVAPFAGLLPGPGGIPMFLAGLAILATNYDWAKNLVDNFENRYEKFVENYLTNNKKVSRSIDLLSLMSALLGVFVFINSEATLFKYLGISMVSFSFFIIISNQKRLEKIIKKFKK